MREDVDFETPQGGPEVHSQLVGEHGPGSAQRRQGLGLPPRAVVGEREKPHRVLAQRVGRDMPFQLGHDLRMAAERESRFRAVLDRHDPQRCQPGRLGSRPVLVGELGEGGASPERQGGVDRVQRLGRLSVVEEGHRRVHEPGEPPRVDGVGVELQQVSGRGAHQYGGRGPRCPVRLQDAAQVGYIDLQRAQSLRRGPALPQIVEEPVRRDHVPAGAHQSRDHRPLERWAQIYRTPCRLGRELPQNPQAHHVQSSIEFTPPVRI